ICQGGGRVAGADGGGGGAGGGCGGGGTGGGYGDDVGGPRRVLRHRPGSSRTSPHDLWRDTLVDAPSTTPTTRAARCTSRSAPPRPDLAGWRRRLAMVAADGGGWRRWRWRWRLATVAPVAVMVGRPSQPKGLTVCRRRRQHVEVGKETGCRRNVDGGKICGSGLGRIAEGTMCRPTTVLLVRIGCGALDRESLAKASPSRLAG
ncbi:Os08g0421000, partial [Oryza sativa Japonica Group]